jgi:hypothetical protein
LQHFKGLGTWIGRYKRSAVCIAPGKNAKRIWSAGVVTVTVNESVTVNLTQFGQAGASHADAKAV